MDLFQALSEWSEVWALLIPFTIILFYKPDKAVMYPVILYICVALVLNTIATILYVFYKQMPDYLQNNNILYNLHTLARVLFFSWYFIKITPRRFLRLYKALLCVYIIFVMVNFLFFESPLFLSTNLFAAGSILLLFLSLTFSLRSIQDESNTNWTRLPSFLVCTAVALYEAVTFFIFLFIYPMAEKDPEFGKLCLKIYQVIFVVFCVLIALALYRSKKQEPIATH